MQVIIINQSRNNKSNKEIKMKVVIIIIMIKMLSYDFFFGEG